MNKPNIAFLGLGIMGSGMARCLLAAGFPLTVFNRNAEKSKSLATEGARIAASPREAAAGAEVIISMVADDNASRSLWSSSSGALSAVKAGAICIECSTLTVGWVRELAAMASSAGCELLDSPVTGSKTQAATGELNFLVGGDAATLEKARPVLRAMSKTISHLGASGSGAMLKLINNFVCGVQLAALAEAIAMIERSQIDRDKALEILTNGAPGSPLVKAVSTRIAKADYTPNFLLRLMEKDLVYAIKEAGQLSLQLETAEAARTLFDRAIANGNGDQDIAAIIEQFRKK